MARINIEDRLFKDPRFSKLVLELGSFELAIGTLISVWLFAQEYWTKTQNGIPLSAWSKRKFPRALIECEFAIIVDNEFVYVKGCKSNFDWLLKRRDAGRKGGLKKSPKLKSLDNFQSKMKQVEASSSSSFSFSSSSSNSKNNNAHLKMREFDFESLYSKYPRKLGKKQGMKTAIRLIKKQDDFDSLAKAIENYSAYCEREIKETRFIKHYSTFMNQWEDYLEPVTESKNNQLDNFWKDFLKENNNHDSK